MENKSTTDITILSDLKSAVAAHTRKNVNSIGILPEMKAVCAYM